MAAGSLPCLTFSWIRINAALAPSLLSQIGLTQEAGASNDNVAFFSNIVTLSPASTQPVIDWRVMQATLPSTPLPYSEPSAVTCPSGSGAGRKMLLSTSHTTGSHASHIGETSRPSVSLSSGGAAGDGFPTASRQLRQTPQGRNPDGSCPIFPDDSPWHMDVTQLPVGVESVTFS